MKKILFFLTSVLTLLASCTKKTEKTVSVSGTGSVSTPIDIATICVAVTTADMNPVIANQANASIMEKVQNALVESGIPRENMETLSYNMDQRTLWKENEIVPLDYQVSNEINIKILDLSKVGKTIDIAIKNGATRMNSITFQSSKSEEALILARELAVKDAQAKALSLAEASGSKLGKVITLVQNDTPDYAKPYRAKTFVAEDLANTPISKESTCITATVNAVYELKN